MTERKENSSSWRKRTRSTQKASKEMATEDKTSTSLALRRKKPREQWSETSWRNSTTPKLTPNGWETARVIRKWKTWKDKKRSWQSWKKLGENRIWLRRKQPIKERPRTNERSHSGGRHKLEQGKGNGGSLEVRSLRKKKRTTAHTAILEMDKCCQEEVEELWKEVACRMEIEVQNHWGIAGKAMKAFMRRADQSKCSEEKVAEKVLRRRKEIFSEEHKRKQWKQSRQ